MLSLLLYKTEETGGFVVTLLKPSCSTLLRLPQVAENRLHFHLLCCEQEHIACASRRFQSPNDSYLCSAQMNRENIEYRFNELFHQTDDTC